MVILLKIMRRDFFSTRQHSHFAFGVMHCKNSEVQIAVFSNETCYGDGNWYKDLLFVYLQPSVNKNSQNLTILILQFDDVTVKTIYRETEIWSSTTCSHEVFYQGGTKKFFFFVFKFIVHVLNAL